MNTQQAAEVEIEPTVADVSQHYALHITPLTDQQATLKGFLLRLQDITTRKQAEAAIQQYTRELENRNTELDVRNAELDTFARTVAQDLKTPLAALLDLSTSLESPADTATYTRAQIAENLHHITQTGQEMTQIVDDLLMLSSIRKIERVDARPLDMNYILERVHKRLERQMASQTVTLSRPATWPVALGYAPWVEEVACATPISKCS